MLPLSVRKSKAKKSVKSKPEKSKKIDNVKDIDLSKIEDELATEQVSQEDEQVITEGED